MTIEAAGSKMIENPSLETLIRETMEMMRITDKTEEFAECWLWQGATSSRGYPIIKNHGGCQLVRRVVFALAFGDLAPRQPVATTCDERLCVNPEHLFPTTIAGVAQAAAKRGSFSGPARCAKIAAARRNGGGKLTIEIAREIRLSVETGPVLAAIHGVNRSLIQRIKAGLAWRDYSSPWAGLM